MNKVILIGNLTKKIELEATGTGTPYTRFSLAVRKNFKNDKGEYDTDFINCVAWRKTAELLSNYTDKGSKVLIEGNIQVRNYETANGEKRYATEVVAESFEFLNNKKEEEPKMQPIDDGDLPF